MADAGSRGCGGASNLGLLVSFFLCLGDLGDDFVSSPLHGTSRTVTVRIEVTNLVRARRIGADLLSSAEVLCRSHRQSAVRRSFATSLVEDFLFNAAGESGGSRVWVGYIIRGHFRPDVVGFAFEGVKHHHHEHRIVCRDSLCKNACAEVTNAFTNRRPSRNILGVGNGKRFLDKSDLSNGSLLLVSLQKFRPSRLGIIRGKEGLFATLDVSF